MLQTMMFFSFVYIIYANKCHDDGTWYPGKYTGNYDDGKWYPGKYDNCGGVKRHCPENSVKHVSPCNPCLPKKVLEQERGHEDDCYSEFGRSKTIGCEGSIYEKIRDDYKRGGYWMEWWE